MTWPLFLAARTGFFLLFLFAPGGAAQIADVRISGERRLAFNEAWRFSKGEIAGAEQVAFNDSSWRPLRLPHDWAIEGPFDRNINPHEGSLPYFGVAWYRKHFKLSGATALGRKQRGRDLTELPVFETVGNGGRFLSRYRLMWQVPYVPGTLRAVAYKDGKQVAVDEVRTAGPPARIVLLTDRRKLAADGDDLSFITLRVEDKDGNLCPMADNLVRFKVDGAGRIAAVDNGDAATVEPFQADYRKAFSGMCLLIVRSEGGKSGSIHVTAAAEGLRSGETSLLAGVQR